MDQKRLSSVATKEEISMWTGPRCCVKNVMHRPCCQKIGEWKGCFVSDSLQNNDVDVSCPLKLNYYSSRQYTVKFRI